MSRTYRRKDLSKISIKCIQENFDVKTSQGKFRDGMCWRGCGDPSCGYCQNNRQHKKIKEYIRAHEIVHEELIG